MKTPVSIFDLPDNKKIHVKVEGAQRYVRISFADLEWITSADKDDHLEVYIDHEGEHTLDVRIAT